MEGRIFWTLESFRKMLFHVINFDFWGFLKINEFQYLFVLFIFVSYVQLQWSLHCWKLKANLKHISTIPRVHVYDMVLKSLTEWFVSNLWVYRIFLKLNFVEEKNIFYKLNWFYDFNEAEWRWFFLYYISVEPFLKNHAFRCLLEVPKRFPKISESLVQKLLNLLSTDFEKLLFQRKKVLNYFSVCNFLLNFL